MARSHAKATRRVTASFLAYEGEGARVWIESDGASFLPWGELYWPDGTVQNSVSTEIVPPETSRGAVLVEVDSDGGREA